MMFLKRKYLFGSFVIACVATACSSMPDTNEVVVKNEFAGVSFKFENIQSETGAENSTDSMYCLLNRIQYTCHYFVKTDLNGVPENKNQVSSSEEITDGSLFDSKLYIKPGEYNMCVFNKPQKGLLVDSLLIFQTTTDVSLRDLVLSVEKRDMSEMDALVGNDGTIAKWIDLNGAYPYIQNISPVSSDIKQNFMINSVEETVLSFSPQRITQRVVIPFQVTVEDGVTISKALMEVSGLARQKYLLNNILVSDYEGTNTARTILKAQNVKTEGNNYFFEVELHSLGLIPNRLDESSIGPGVIQLGIFAEASGKNKTLRTTKNISRFLREENSVEYNKVEDYYKVKNYDVVLNTGFRFMITKEQVMSDTEDGVHEWDDEDNDMEGEI